MKATILVGDVLDRLRGLADESVHCVVTSPPYWGLRDYKIPPSVWGGEAGCAHEWGERKICTEVGKGNWAQGTNGRGERQPGGAAAKRQAIAGESTVGFCRRCGAWRGCLGLEPRPELYVQHIVEVFREVRRVLRRDGTLWLNLGDSYATGAGGVGACPGGGAQGARWAGDAARLRDGKRGYRGDRLANGHGTAPETLRRKTVPGFRGDRDGDPKRGERAAGAVGIGPMAQPNRLPIEGCKPKDLVGIPWMVAFALRADGWYLRQDIIWAKRNTMPESVRDRCTKAHEYLFLLAKSRSYYYDAEAVEEPASEDTHARYARGRSDHHKFADGGPGDQTIARSFKHMARKLAEPGERIKNNGSFDAAMAVMPGTRNKRSVWEIATQPYSGAHFATFPEALVEPCLLAGTSEHGACPRCGAPWRRVVLYCGGAIGRSWNDHLNDPVEGHRNHRQEESHGRNGKPPYRAESKGWRPSCGHAAGETAPCLVMDPFCGSGTTGAVALRLSRDFLGIEISRPYSKLIEARVGDVAPLLNQVEVVL